MTNFELRSLIKSKRLFFYEIAAKIGISEFTFTRWLREELNEEKRTKVLTAIKELTGEEE